MIAFPKYPKTSTASAHDYFLADIEAVNFLHWVVFMAGTLDKIRETARRALKDTKYAAEVSRQRKEPNKSEGMIEELKRNRRILIQMLHARMTDNYLTYLKGILGEAFRSRPEILKSSEKVEISEVLSFNNINDLVDSLAEKKVDNLSYKSVSDLADFFENKLNVALVPSSDRDSLVKAVATRNIIVHNRGVRNKVYCANVGESEEMVGKLRDIGIEYVEKTHGMFYKSVVSVDSRMRKKLGIKGQRKDVRAAFRSVEA